MKTVSVTIYYDEGSMGSNPALPLKPPKGGFLIVPETLIVLTKESKKTTAIICYLYHLSFDTEDLANRFFY